MEAVPDVSKANLVSFFASFRLELAGLLTALKTAGAVATGGDLILFLAGAWEQSLLERPRALVVDLLYAAEQGKGKAVLVKYLARQGYRCNGRARCSHFLGEWRSLPPERVQCLVTGELDHRVVHLVELPRPPVEVVLSRVYGSMVGTYLTGSGRAVSLFPYLTFYRHRCWFPHGVASKRTAELEWKYHGWTKGQVTEKDIVDEVGASFRTADDEYCWIVQFSAEGNTRSSRLPRYSYAVEGDDKKTPTGQDDKSKKADRHKLVGFFPSMMASVNVNGMTYSSSTWIWKQGRDRLK